MNQEQVKALVRPNVLRLRPYSSARDEFEGVASVYLDANENPFPSDYNRYPDPHQKAVKSALASLKQVRPDQIFLGNGSDEAIDLIIRTFCDPGVHNIAITQPTYGMYQVSADINDVAVRAANLTPQFDLDVEELLKNVDYNTRIIFLCSPNNPSGNLLSSNYIEKVITSFDGIVVVDEAYIDFASAPSWVGRLDEFQNLIVLQTFSKAWGLANLRIGMAFGSTFIIELLNKIKPPYNISGLTQKLVLEALQKAGRTKDIASNLVAERERLRAGLEKIQSVEVVFPSDANFLLVRVADARAKYAQLLKQGIVVRDRSNVRLCEGCLRITVGTPVENDQVLEALGKL